MKNAISLGLAFTCLLATTTAGAQQPPTPATPYASRQMIPVWEGQIPGSVNPAQHESTVEVPGRGVHIVRNVTVPTLTVFPAKAANRTKKATRSRNGFRNTALPPSC
jgi:hypothetical protein